MALRIKNPFEYFKNKIKEADTKYKLTVIQNNIDNSKILSLDMYNKLTKMILDKKERIRLGGR